MKAALVSATVVPEAGGADRVSAPDCRMRHRFIGNCPRSQSTNSAPSLQPSPTAKLEADDGGTRTSSFRRRCRHDGSLFHEHLLRGGRGAVPGAADMNGRERELDAVLVEGLLDHGERAAADHELLVWLRHHLEPKLDRIVSELFDALHLQRLEDVRRELRVGRELLADRLDELFRLLDIGVVGYADRHLVDDPVAAHVLHRAELAEGNGVDRPAVMAELHRAQAERLDRTLVIAALDI